MQTNRLSTGASCVSEPQSEPTPLFGELREADPVPWEALGPLSDPVNAIATLTQAPAAIAMQSVLAVASTVTQSLRDVETLQEYSPLSLFFLTIAKSGERKSACDGLATRAIKRIDHERELIYREERRAFDIELAEYQKGKRRKPKNDFDVIEYEPKKRKIDLAPEAPLVPTLLIGDATIEGLHRRLETGTPSVAVMTDEGGQFFGGHSMKQENALKTAAGFSKLWDGSPWSKSRASSEPAVLYGKRVSLHLMIQPGVAQKVVGDPTMKDQGLLSRVLMAWPDSKIGSRQIRDDPSRISEEETAKAVLHKFDERIMELLRLELPIDAESRADLKPSCLQLCDTARKKLVEFYNRVEQASNTGEAFEYLTGFAAKAPEIAARIAGVQTLYADENATEITADKMANGIAIMDWYLSETVRITETGRPNEELCWAEELRLWLLNKWEEEFIDKRNMTKFGPNHLRDGDTLSRCIQKLEEHGHLVRETGGQMINGKKSQTYWRVVRQRSKALRKTSKDPIFAAFENAVLVSPADSSDNGHGVKV